jgi:DNA polymerase III epsilon subunit-like protein
MTTSLIDKMKHSTPRYIMVFDFETTGLPKNAWTDYSLTPTNDMRTGHFIPASNEADFPHAVQLSYILYDTEKNTAKIFDEVIRLPEGITISPESQAIHHISLEKTQGKTRRVLNRNTKHYRKQYNLTMDEIIRKFMPDFRKADIVVSHNIQFDRNILLVEMDRLRQTRPIFNSYIQEIYTNKKMYCTAKNGAFVCKIAALNRLGKPYYKMPKLTVLYVTLFGKEDQLDESKLHNALYDVVICLRCFIKMRYDVDIYGKNAKITSLFDNIIVRTK